MCCHVWLLATTWTVAHRAPLSIGFPTEEHWSGLPFPPLRDIPNPGIQPLSPESPALAGRCFTTELPVAAAKSLQSCPTLCDPIDGSPPGSPVPGILQARTLEWVAIAFSNAWKWKGKVKSFSPVWLFATSWTTAYQAPPSLGFSRQEYWSGVPFPSPGDLPYPGIEPGSPALQTDALPPEPPGKPDFQDMATNTFPTSRLRTAPEVTKIFAKLFILVSQCPPTNSHSEILNRSHQSCQTCNCFIYTQGFLTYKERHYWPNTAAYMSFAGKHIQKSSKKFCFTSDHFTVLKIHLAPAAQCLCSTLFPLATNLAIFKA